MATLAQIDANRRNSTKSTGPSSVEGKAVTRMNALQSGLYAESSVIRGESSDSLKGLAAQFQQDYQPQTAGEQVLIDNLVAGAWTLRRLVKVEAHIWERQFEFFERRDRFDPKIFLGDAYDSCSTTFVRHQRRYDAISREFRQNLKELSRLQAGRPTPEPVEDAMPEPVPQPEPAPEPPAPEIGFVPSPEPPAQPQTPQSAAPAPEIGFVPSPKPEWGPLPHPLHPKTPQDCPKCRPYGKFIPVCHFRPRRD